MTTYTAVELVDDETGTTKLTATLLGSATSDDGKRERWQEVQLYRAYDGTYYAQSFGHTRVYGERTFQRVFASATALILMDRLFVARSNATAGVDRWLPRPAREALAQAAGADDNMRDAYVALKQAGQL